MNLLKNPLFDSSHYEPKNENALVIPNGWESGCLDEGSLWRFAKDGRVYLGAFNKYGPRGRPNVKQVLKPEILEIAHVIPYLAPPRVEDGSNSVTMFKLYGTICGWLSQKVSVQTYTKYRLSCRAHAWAHDDNDPEDNAAYYTHGIGYSAFNELEGSAGLNDDKINFRFRVGYDPAGGDNPFAASVIWGIGAHIYNYFANLPALEFTPETATITVFIMVDNLWGFHNSNAYISRPVLEVATEPSGRGAPREQYKRVYHVIPQEATLSRAFEIQTIAWHESRATCGGSYDDAGVGDLDDRTAVLWDIPDAEKQVYLDWYAQWYPSVKVEFRPKKVDPPVPPAPIYKRGRSMGGLHIEVTGSHEGYGAFLQRCADAGRPVGVIKSFFDGGALMQAKSVSPDTVTIWRGRPLSSDDDNPRNDWIWDTLDTKDIADQWMYELCERWKFDRAVTDYLEVCNEPNGALEIQFINQRDFWIECMRYADEHGFKVAIGSFSSGCPEPEQLDVLAPALDYAAKHGHILACHDGSVEAGRPLFQQAYQDGTGLRYRMFKQRMDALGYQMPMVAITECYWPGGNKNQNPWSDMAWYLAELAKDPYVLGMSWFSLGSYTFGEGGEVNNAEQLPRFADVIVSMPVVE